MASDTALTTSLAQAADTILKTKGTTLRDWLNEQAATGVGVRLIASRLHAATDGVVSPAHETIRRWIDQLDDEVAA